MTHLGRFRFRARTTDSQGSYQELSGTDVNRLQTAAREQFRLATETVAGEGERMIAEGKQAMAEFKKASARRWGRESSAAATEDRVRANDRSLSPIRRFIAASRAFRCMIAFAAIFLCIIPAFAQSCVPGSGMTCTPNLNLSQPPAGYLNWASIINYNWSLIVLSHG